MYSFCSGLTTVLGFRGVDAKKNPAASYHHCQRHMHLFAMGFELPQKDRRITWSQKIFAVPLILSGEILKGTAKG